MVTIEKEKLQKLVDCFYEARSLSNECNLYEWEEGDKAMTELKDFVDNNFGRKLEKIK